jgi:PEGA domain-containing protein
MGDDRYQPQDRDQPQDRADTRRDDSWPANRERGTLRLAVSPTDASIYVDGTFRGTGDDLRRLSLPEGRHRIEVVRPGYRTVERDVEVQAGETEEVDVDLPRS